MKFAKTTQIHNLTKEDVVIGALCSVSYQGKKLRFIENFNTEISEILKHEEIWLYHEENDDYFWYLTKYQPQVGHHVECQPMHGNQPRGASFSTMIQEIMPDGTYRIRRKGKDRFIKRKEILGQNWEFK